MKAVSRLGNLLLAGMLALAPVPALAQQTPASTTETPATNAIGPRDLQNFSLNGTVTRPSDQPIAVPPAAPATRRAAQTETPPPAAQSSARSAAPAQSPLSTAPRRTQTAAGQLAPQTQRAPESVQPPAPASAATAVPTLGGSSAAAPAPAAAFAPDPEPAGTLGPEHKFAILPWLLAALALGAGGAFLFWRNRSREAFAGRPQVDAFVAPVPAPAPRRAPAPPPPAPKASDPSSMGIVSTRLRPWIEIGFTPLRCIVEKERVTIEFEIEMFNSGSAPARAVLVEASLFDAGPAQDQQIDGFFANPVAEGERIAAIPPLKRVALKTQVAAPRDKMQTFQLGGRQVIIPLIAFNALYSWRGGEGQTSVSYLVGLDTKSEKVGPFRLDLGPRIFRSVAARILPNGIRR